MTPESGEVDETDERETRRRWRRLSYIAGQGEEGGCRRPCRVPVPATVVVTSHRRAGRREEIG